MSDFRVIAAWRRAPTRLAVPCRLWLLVLVGALSCVACSAVIDSDKRKLGALPIACEPGQSVPCPCRDGSMSTQRCNALARYDRCACAAPDTGDAPSSGAAGKNESAAGGSAGQGGRAGGAGRAPRSGSGG